MFLSYRNQSIDLLRKPMDWFLYQKDTGRRKVKKIPNINFRYKFLWNFKTFHNFYSFLPKPEIIEKKLTH